MASRAPTATLLALGRASAPLDTVVVARLLHVHTLSTRLSQLLQQHHMPTDPRSVRRALAAAITGSLPSAIQPACAVVLTHACTPFACADLMFSPGWQGVQMTDDLLQGQVLSVRADLAGVTFELGTPLVVRHESWRGPYTAKLVISNLPLFYAFRGVGQVLLECAGYRGGEGLACAHVGAEEIVADDGLSACVVVHVRGPATDPGLSRMLALATCAIGDHSVRIQVKSANPPPPLPGVPAAHVPVSSPAPAHAPMPVREVDTQVPAPSPAATAPPRHYQHPPAATAPQRAQPAATATDAAVRAAVAALAAQQHGQQHLTPAAPGVATCTTATATAFFSAARSPPRAGYPPPPPPPPWCAGQQPQYPHHGLLPPTSQQHGVPASLAHAYGMHVPTQRPVYSPLAHMGLSGLGAYPHAQPPPPGTESSQHVAATAEARTQLPTQQQQQQQQQRGPSMQPREPAPPPSASSPRPLLPQHQHAPVPMPGAATPTSQGEQRRAQEHRSAQRQQQQQQPGPNPQQQPGGAAPPPPAWTRLLLPPSHQHAPVPLPGPGAAASVSQGEQHQGQPQPVTQQQGRSRGPYQQRDPRGIQPDASTPPHRPPQQQQQQQHLQHQHQHDTRASRADAADTWRQPVSTAGSDEDAPYGAPPRAPLPRPQVLTDLLALGFSDEYHKIRKVLHAPLGGEAACLAALTVAADRMLATYGGEPFRPLIDTLHMIMRDEQGSALPVFAHRLLDVPACTTYCVAFLLRFYPDECRSFSAVTTPGAVPTSVRGALYDCASAFAEHYAPYNAPKRRRSARSLDSSGQVGPVAQRR